MRREERELGKRVSIADDVTTKTWLDLSDRLPKSVLSAVQNIDETFDK